MKRFLTVIVLVSVLSMNAFAIQTYNFGIFTDNGAYNDSSSAAYSVEVFGVGKEVTFNICNNSSIGSSVQEIYVDDEKSLIKNINKVSNTYNKKTQEGVKFTKSKTGSFNAPDFDTQSKLSLKAVSKSQSTGIDTGEHLKITYKLTKGTTYDDVIAAIEAKQLKIGLNINSFPDSSSESALSLYTLAKPQPDPLDYPVSGDLPLGPGDDNPTDRPCPPVVPVPAAAILALIGVGCVTSLRKKIA